MSTNRTGWIAAAIVAVVGLAGITAVVATSGDDSPKKVDFQEIRDVSVTGTPLAAYAGPQTDPAVGQPAPRIEGKTIGGTPLSIKPGKPTMLVFLAHWCSHCQAEVPRLVKWHHGEETPAALDVIGVASGTDTASPNYPPSEWLVREEWPWPVMADNATSAAMASFGFTSFPAFVLIDSDGIVRFRYTGELEAADLDAVLSATLGLT